jgi:hypothetical protein
VNKLIWILLWFSVATLKSAETMNKRQHYLEVEVPKYTKLLSQCRLDQTISLKQKLKDGVIPAMEVSASAQKPEGEYFRATKNLGQVSTFFFPPAKVFIPFALLADILASPYYLGEHIVGRIQYHQKEKAGQAEIRKNIEKFKKEWEKIESNPIKRRLLINQIYVYSFVSDVHSWFIIEKGQGTPPGRENYDFMVPYFEKNLGMKIVKEKNEWQMKIPKKGWRPLYRYFHLDDFKKILEKNPSLCRNPGLDSLELIGKEYSAIMNQKMNEF